VSSTRALGPGSGIYWAFIGPRRQVSGFWRLGLARAKRIVGLAAEQDGIGDQPVGIDLRPPPVLGAVPGRSAQMRKDLGDHGGIFDGGDDRQGPTTLGQCSRSISNTRLSSRAQLMPAGVRHVTSRYGSCRPGKEFWVAIRHRRRGCVGVGSCASFSEGGLRDKAANPPYGFCGNPLKPVPSAAP
jgi:hypothetical protein